MDATIGYDLMGRVTSKGATAFAATSTLVYNAKGQLSTETSTKTEVSGGNTKVTTTIATHDYGAGGAYALGAALTITTTSSSVTNGGSPVTNPTSRMTNTYVWWDGAVQNTQSYKPNISSGPTHDSTYTYANVGGSAQLTTVVTDDGRPRTVTFRNDMNGQAIRRDEADNNGSVGDPHEVWYRFAGKQIGFTGNNGAPDGEFANSPNGPFGQGGSNSPTYYTDFDLSLTSYAFNSSRSVASTYVVEQGDTLESIAAMLWGDSSLWYQLAEANGLQGGAQLTAGQTLIIPAGVVRSTHNAGTFAPYDPGEVINPITLTSPKPSNQGKKCGGFGTVLLVAIAIVVAVKLGPQAASFFTKIFGGTAAQAAAAATAISGGSVVAGSLGAAGTAGVVVGGASAGVAASVASQAVGVATGIQDKFSWSQVALAAVSGGVGGGLAVAGVGGALRGALGSAITQGIGVATGLQKSFSWAGVAAAGVGAAVGDAVGGGLLGAGIGDSTGRQVASLTASAFADAATRSLIEGSDFGDNMLAALPNVVAQLVANGIVSGRIANGASERTLYASDAPRLYADNSEYGATLSDAGGGGSGHWYDGVVSAYHGAMNWLGDLAGFDNGSFSFGNIGLSGSNAAAWSDAGEEIVVTRQRSWLASASVWYDNTMRYSAESNSFAQNLHAGAAQLRQMGWHGAADVYDTFGNGVTRMHYNFGRTLSDNVWALGELAYNLSPEGQMNALTANLGFPVNPNGPNANNVYRPLAESYTAANELYWRFQLRDPTLASDAMTALRDGLEGIGARYFADFETGVVNAMGDVGTAGGHLATIVLTDGVGRLGGTRGAGAAGGSGDVAANAALHARYVELLRATEAANPIVESLRATGRLPSNYVTFGDALAAGWQPGKALEHYLPGAQIGGNTFRNSPGVVPGARGRTWYEADINVPGPQFRQRGGERLLYSNDGLLYVSPDHYTTPAHYIGRY